MVRVLICGDREWKDSKLIRGALKALTESEGVDLVIDGGARGADSIGYRTALKLGLLCRRFHAKWKVHGRAAGPMRNQQMLDEGKPDLVLAFHNDISHSRGTKDMVRRAERAKIPVHLYSYRDGKAYRKVIIGAQMRLG